MTNSETIIRDYVLSIYPNAIIEAYYWTTREMVFQLSPDTEQRGSCVLRNGKLSITLDF